MKAVGMLLVVVGILILAYEVIMGVAKYHLNRPHDMHRFIIGIVVGLVIAIIGGLLGRRGGNE
jgi:hypothetical protein